MIKVERVRGDGVKGQKVKEVTSVCILTLSSLLTFYPPHPRPQCFSRIMDPSWGQKSAAPPVSSPAREDRCKVGGERHRETERERDIEREMEEEKQKCSADQNSNSV